MNIYIPWKNYFSRKRGCMIREQDKHFLWSLYVAVGIIFVWKGIWEGMYELTDNFFPALSDPFVFLFLGLTMLTLSGIVFHEFDPLGSVDKSVSKIIHKIQNHPHSEEFQVKYHDKVKKKDITVRADRIQRFEKGCLIVEHELGGQERFIPSYRITEVLHKGRQYWRL